MTLHARPSGQLTLESGEPLLLGPPLSGTTGEGTVYGVADRPDWAAKIFHPTLKDLEVKLDKVAAMVRSTPPGAIQPDGLVVLTWPLHTLVDGRGPVGYVMPRISTATAVELHTMSNPSDRENPAPTGPQWTRNASWGHLVNVAANLCLAMEVVHRVEAVIGDFQERNILVSDTTQVTLVDCDSMQFIDRSGRQFLCGVGRPEFTAPELAGVNLREQTREKPSDLFALAVHIHQLLMAGNHPFLRGEWIGGGDHPDALILARSGDWAGGPNSRLRTHPLAPPVTFLPSEIQQYFARAFTLGTREPSARPTAAEWRGALSRIRLVACVRGVHQIPAGNTACPWCAIEEERATRTGRLASSRSAGVTGPRPVVPPSVSDGRAGPTTGRQPVTPNDESGKIFGVSHTVYLVALAAVVLIVVALAAFIVWALLSGSSSTFESLRGPMGSAVNVQVGGVGDGALKL